jgi:hypothetical protein
VDDDEDDSSDFFDGLGEADDFLVLEEEELEPVFLADEVDVPVDFFVVDVLAA